MFGWMMSGYLKANGARWASKSERPNMDESLGGGQERPAANKHIGITQVSNGFIIYAENPIVAYTLDELLERVKESFTT